MDKVMRLDACEGEGKFNLLVMLGESGVGEQLGGSALPSAPDLGRCQTHGRIIARQAPVVGGEQILPLRLRDVGEVRLPRVGVKNRSPALVKPVNLLLAKQENAAKHQFGD